MELKGFQKKNPFHVNPLIYSFKYNEKNDFFLPSLPDISIAYFWMKKSLKKISALNKRRDEKIFDESTTSG